MPSTVTHSYFMMDIYEKLPISRKEFLKDQKEKMRVFAQSTDPFNFYFSLHLKKGAKIRKFAEYSHTKKTGEFLIILTNYIKYNGFCKDPEVMAFLYGMISHYVLDSTVHPYVYYKTGTFDARNKSSYQYNAKHHELETMIDKYMIKTREEILPYRFKHYEICLQNPHFSKNLIEVMDFSYREVFGIKNIHLFFSKSINHMRYAFRFLRYDPYGIKGKCYSFLDFLLPNRFLNLKFLSYHYLPGDYSYFLNKQHLPWYYPTTKTKKRTLSFIDLYLLSLSKALKIISTVDQYIYENKKVDLKQVYKNLSYKTGMDLDKNQKLKYFEF